MLNNISNIDDATVIKKFFQGDKDLVANSNIRIEGSGSSLQLIAKQSEMLATLTLIEKRRVALVRATSQYWQLIHRLLIENNFVAWGNSKQKGFVEYQQWVPPPGYQIKYTEVVELWKQWWPNQRYHKKHDLDLEMLIFLKNNWYPIQNITVEEGTFYVKTLVGQLKLTSKEKILWASKITKPTAKDVNDRVNISSNDELVKERRLSEKKPFLVRNFSSSFQEEIKPEINLSAQVKSIQERAVQNFANNLEEIVQMLLERVLQAEQRAERLAARLREVGVDPDEV